MKKRFLSVISAAVALIMCVAVSSGCKLITKDSEREMNSVVATVNVNTEEHVYKKDMIMAYLSFLRRLFVHTPVCQHIEVVDQRARLGIEIIGQIFARDAVFVRADRLAKTLLRRRKRIRRL